MEIPDPIALIYRGFPSYLEIQLLAGGMANLSIGQKSTKPMAQAAALAKGIASLTLNAKQPLSLLTVGFRFRVDRKQVPHPLFKVSR